MKYVLNLLLPALAFAFLWLVGMGSERPMTTITTEEDTNATDQAS